MINQSYQPMQRTSSPLILLLVLLCFSASTSVSAQDITLQNPSFEDLPRHSHVPRFWNDCGFPNESPPDVQPDLTFRVSTPSYDGNTYLGMVARDNETYESVSQLLSAPLQEGQCYSFSIKLARSLSYISQSRRTNEAANYVTPVKLRIYGGFGQCDRRQLLDESPLVSNPQWMQYNFKFEPEANYTHFVLEVFYKTPSLFPYNGNLLLDDCSAISPIPCDEEVPDAAEPPQPTSSDEPLADVGTRSPDEYNTTPTTPVTSDPTPAPAPANNTLAGVDRSEMRTGATITLNNIQFEADSSRIIQQSVPALEELRNFLDNNGDLAVEIGGHTNGWADTEYAITLSTARAKSVADYLISKGIDRRRVTYKGYGKDKPIDTNATPEGRRRNQRVEIKILRSGS